MKALSCRLTNLMAFTASAASSCEPCVGMIAKISPADGVANHHRGRTFEIHNDKSALSRGLFDSVDNRVLGHVGKDHKIFRLAWSLGPSRDRLVGVGIDRW